MLFGFGVFLISTGLFYGLPLPVQPMKAVSAVILTDGLKPGEVAAAGMMLGIVLLALGITGWIGRLARAIPKSVSAGLQLGLGLLMGVLGVKLILQTPWIGFSAVAALFLLTRVPRCPAALIVLAAAGVVGWLSNSAATPSEITFAASLPQVVIPAWSEVWQSLGIAVLPQLSLTLTNAVIVTASLSRELFVVALAWVIAVPGIAFAQTAHTHQQGTVPTMPGQDALGRCRRSFRYSKPTRRPIGRRSTWKPCVSISSI